MSIIKSNDKYKTLCELIKQDHILVHINTGTKGVEIPESYKSTPTLTLKLSMHFQGQMVMAEDVITASLVFDGKYFDCSIPLNSIWGCTSADNKNFIWPESISKDSYDNLKDSFDLVKDEKEPKVEKEAKPARPTLKRIK